MPTFPPVPFDCTLSSNARAQNANGADLGLVFKQFKAEQIFAVGALFAGRMRIDDPLWDGTKQFWIKQEYVTPYTKPEPPEEPDPDDGEYLTWQPGHLQMQDVDTGETWTLADQPARFKKSNG